MKKLISVTILSLFVLLIFVGCKKGGNDPEPVSEKFALTVEGAEFLYEQPKAEYAAGERVTIKTHILCDASLTVAVEDVSSGTPVSTTTDGFYTHGEYSFDMPNKDTTVRIFVTPIISKRWDEIEVEMAYVGYTRSGPIFDQALNSDAAKKGGVHLPIHRFDSRTELMSFIEALGGADGSMGYDEVQSLGSAIGKYGDDVFEESSLFIVYVYANSGSYRFGIDTVKSYGSLMMVTVDRTNAPSVCTTNMAGWFLFFTIPKESLNSLTGFDAVLEPSYNTDAPLHIVYPEYFGLDASGGLDVIVWQMAEELYAFGLLPHSDTPRGMIDEELMSLRAVNAEQMRKILDSYSIADDDIYIIPWQNPISSYLCEYFIHFAGKDPTEARQAYIEKIREMISG